MKTAGTRVDGARRREAILDAALRCFAERGVLATGIEDVRREAGANPSSVYHLFGGITGVTFAVLTRTFERLFAHLAERVTKASSAESTVKALVEGQIEWILRHREEGRVMYEAMALELDPKAMRELQTKKAAFLAPVTTHFARFISSGELPRWSVLELEVVLLGPTHEACRRFLAGAPISQRWMRAELPALAWRSLPRPRATNADRSARSRTRRTRANGRDGSR